MRKLTVVLGLAVASAACSLAATAQAANVLNIDYSFPPGLACYAPGTNESVDVSGRDHDSFMVTVNGNNVQLHGVSNLQNVSAVGETTGLNYRFTGGANNFQNQSLQDGQAVFAFQVTNRTRLRGWRAEHAIHGDLPRHLQRGRHPHCRPRAMDQ